MVGNRREDEQEGFQVGLRPRPGARGAARAVIAAGRGRVAGNAGPGRLGVVLGTGLGGLADRLVGDWSMPARDTGWLIPSSALGHAGRIVCGRLPGSGSSAAGHSCGVVPACGVMMLQGRVHAYEGHATEALVRGVELLAALGATTILLTNAAGGLRPDMRTGELMILDDHIDLVRGPWAAGEVQDRLPCRGGRIGAPEPCYDSSLVAGGLEAARAAGVPARAGVYAYLRGPSYETRAEYRMLRRFGADAVGMSTVPEAVAARRLGLRVAAVSVITNVARPDVADGTDAEDVCRAAAAAAEGIWAILGRIAAVTAVAAVDDGLEAWPPEATG